MTDDMTTPSTKPRSDAWDADLTDAQRWQAYDIFRRSPWYKVSDWAAKEFHLETPPGRAALYRWNKRMREMESDHNIDQAIQARAEIGALAGTVSKDEALINAYQSMASDLALHNNASEAVKYTSMAMSIAATAIKRRDQDLREREIAIKEADSSEVALDLLLREAGENERAKALLKQFTEALGK